MAGVAQPASNAQGEPGEEAWRAPRGSRVQGSAGDLAEHHTLV